MNGISMFLSIIRADFLERSRRSSFLITLCLVLYLGYAVNSGQVLISLGGYRGIYNSAWVGSLMALVINFFLGLGGFFLVKNAIERDERTGVGQIIATTSITRPQYLLAKWLSNFAVLAALVGVLALAAFFMQVIHGEEARVQLWPLFAPFLFVSLPMMALVAAFAVFFESVPWLKGGFGNLIYFFVFIFLLAGGIQLAPLPGVDVLGFNWVGTVMRTAAKAAFPAYNGNFTFSMASRHSLETFVWPGLDWTAGVIAQRLLWGAVAIGMTLAGGLFFNRFDPGRGPQPGKARKSPSAEGEPPVALPDAGAFDPGCAALPPLASDRRFHFNFLRLVGLECRLLVKGLQWYWWAGMAALWAGCALVPSGSLRQLGWIFVSIWPVLVWSKLGERDARYQVEPLIAQTAYPLLRPLVAAWLAGGLFTAGVAGGVLLGRCLYGEPVALLPWGLSVLFIPTLALVLGVWSRSSRAFEVIYPILWYLGPFNPQSQLAVIDYLGIHAEASVIQSPLLFAGAIGLLWLGAMIGRRRQGSG